MKKIEVIQRVFLILSIPQSIGTIIASVVGMIGVVILLMNNPFWGILFGVLLAIVAFAIIAIFVRGREEKREAVDLEKKILLQKGLKTRPVRHDGEPQIRVYQIFSNVSDFNVEITKIEAILKGESNKTIDQFFYNASDPIHKDEDKLIFPKEIPPPSLNVEIEYRISGEEKLTHLEHTGYLKQVITFSNGATTIIKHPADKPVYGEGIGSR